MPLSSLWQRLVEFWNLTCGMEIFLETHASKSCRAVDGLLNKQCPKAVMETAGCPSQSRSSKQFLYEQHQHTNNCAIMCNSHASCKLLCGWSVYAGILTSKQKLESITHWARWNALQAQTYLQLKADCLAQNSDLWLWHTNQSCYAGWNALQI